MTFTLHLGWWLVPLAITVAAFGMAAWSCRDQQPSYDYAATGAAAVSLIIYGAALIVSMAAWLIWAVLT